MSERTKAQEADRAKLLAWIDDDREANVAFLSRFVRAASPNPPGDTREAAAVLISALDGAALDVKTIAPQEAMPNILATFEGRSEGRHLVLNGHIDVFPAKEASEGERDPFSGAVEDGCIYGRGVSDMKCGTASLLLAFRYLHRLKDSLCGRLTYTAVSDEETGGRWGARYLMENHKDAVLGDCMLSGEPSGVHTLRFGEKGTLRLTFTARTNGAHGAYPHLSQSANKIMIRLGAELQRLEALAPSVPQDIQSALAAPGVAEAIDASLGAGAAEVVQRVTVNIGVLRGGLKVNVLPDECHMEVDIRLPIGIDKARVQGEIDGILADYPEVTASEHVWHTYPSSVCAPSSDMVTILQDNVEALMGLRPAPMISLGGSDARYWRWAGVNAYLYGPSPVSMGQRDEHVTLDEFHHVLRAHALSAYDYLSAG